MFDKFTLHLPQRLDLHVRVTSVEIDAGDVEVLAHFLDGVALPAVASLGTNPTFVTAGAVVLEVSSFQMERVDAFHPRGAHRNLLELAHGVVRAFKDAARRERRQAWRRLS